MPTGRISILLVLIQSQTYKLQIKKKNVWCAQHNPITKAKFEHCMTLWLWLMTRWPSSCAWHKVSWWTFVHKKLNSCFLKIPKCTKKLWHGQVLMQARSHKHLIAILTTMSCSAQAGSTKIPLPLSITLQNRSKIRCQQPNLIVKCDLWPFVTLTFIMRKTIQLIMEDALDTGFWPTPMWPWPLSLGSRFLCDTLSYHVEHLHQLIL
jgi:hypothetical protein